MAEWVDRFSRTASQLLRTKVTGNWLIMRYFLSIHPGALLLSPFYRASLSSRVNNSYLAVAVVTILSSGPLNPPTTGRCRRRARSEAENNTAMSIKLGT
jgi:hypothetical protein